MYRWEGTGALVQTVDFFTPIVDDPYLYGQIAAANALSDVYAMGGRPLTALAIAGFPRSGLEPGVIKAVFRGGFDKLREAGVALLGGHTVQDAEIKFGYAITGVVDPARVLSNAGARPGDVLLLTKPIGTGVIATALKFDRAPASAVDAAVRSMTTLNRAAAEAMRTVAPGVVRACTDVTGFGLIGHATEVASASRVTLRIESGRVPLLEGARELARGNRSGGMGSNQEHFGQWVRVGGAVDPDLLLLLYDPQTSGGLLVAADPAGADALGRALLEAGVFFASIGRVEPASDVLMAVD